MDTRSDDGLADDLVLDIPTPHETLSQTRPSAYGEPGSRRDVDDDGASWYSKLDTYDSDSADDDHSHDLTHLAGRASVMDNMLLSLDQLEPSSNHLLNASIQHSDLPDFPFDNSAPRRLPRNPTRRRNHGHSSSYSSGYSLPYYEGGPGKRMHGRTRGESGSSSGATLQGGFSRGEKVSLGHGLSSVSADGQRRRYNGETPGSTLHSQHARGARTKGSKGSNSSSFDMSSRGAVLAPPPGLGNLNHPARRTASMDQLPCLETTRGVGGASSIIQKANPIHSSNYDFLDAAPTPTVLQGPRKMTSSTTFGQPSPVLSQPPLSPLLGSSRPTTGNRIRKARNEIPDPSVFRSQANDFVDSATSREFFLPGHNLEGFPAPSPHLSSSQKGWHSASSTAPTATRERPGFFRRVFGSSKSSTPATSISAAARQYQSFQGDSVGAEALLQHQQPQQHIPPLGQHHIASQMIHNMPPAGQRPSIKDFSTTDQEQIPFPPPAAPPTPPLTKKHSSFFRRRKKSVSDAIRGNSAAPSTTPQAQPLGNVDINIGRHPPSMSSLRQVMNPYLGDSETSDVYFGSSENQMRYPRIDRYREDNDSGIVPLPSQIGNGSATIRAVNPAEERERSDWNLTHLGNEMAENIQAAGKLNIDSPKFKLKMRGRSNSSTGFGSNGTNNTFYVENSSAEASDQNILAYLDNRDDMVPPDSVAKLRPVTSPTVPRPSQSRSVPAKFARQRAAHEKQLVVPGTFANSPSSPQQEFHNATSWVTSSETSLTEPVKATNRHHPPPTSSSSAGTVAAVPRPPRVWLHPDSSEEDLEEPNRAPPLPPPPHPIASDANTPNFSSTKSTPQSTHDAFQSATSLPALQPGDGEVDDEVKPGSDDNVEFRSKEGAVGSAKETSSSMVAQGLGIEKETGTVFEPQMNARVRHPAQEPDALALAAAADTADTAAFTDSGISTAGVPISATIEDRAVAQHIFDGTDDFANSPDRAVGILGDADAASARVRMVYMELFDWSGINILTALRALCAKLLLRGESQQMDRVLDAFSERWCACNVNHGFKARDVVHTISYSILLLNTDLHLANIENKMTRTQFVKNTLPTISRVVADAVPDLWDQTIRPAMPQKKNSIPWSPVADKENGFFSLPTGAAVEGSVTDERKGSLEIGSRGRNRLSIRSPLVRQDSDTQIATGTNSAGAGADAAAGLSDNCNVLVRFPYEGPLQGWETHLEIILKAFYDSIRRQPLPLHGSSRNGGVGNANLTANEPASSSLSVMTSSMLRRTPSVMSKAPSENLSINYRSCAGGSSISGGGRGGTFSDFRSVGFRWTSKSRSRPRVYHSSTMGSSTSRTSLDDHSPWSPAGSSTWSKLSHSRTQPTTAASVDSFRSQFTQPDYQQSIGFANALSQAIIREEGIASAAAMATAANGTLNVGTGTGTGVSIAESSPEDLISRREPLLDDETLELAGAPWAKEGILKHKHHLEALDKRAKDRTWSECFAVVEKGYMKLFSFNGGGKSSSSSTTMRLRTGRMPRGKRAASVSNTADGTGAATGAGGGATVVGGGNWSSNAVSLGSFLLRQTIASVLPPPGYSKTRPHVWALSLPTGAVHLFQAGTPDIVREFVSTANYWSARLSKEPLIGGVSNIEYGWSDSVLGSGMNADSKQLNDGPPAAMSSLYGGRLGSSSGAGPGAAGSKISLSLPGRTPSSSAAGASRPMSPSSVSTLSAAYQQQQRPSLHSSIRSSMDQHGGAGRNVNGSNSTKVRLPGDRITVSEWTPPTQSMMASALLEVDQLRALTDYVKNVEDELSRHNELRATLVAAYNPRQSNHARATNNWERKSAYLLREIVKFRTYIDSLTAAQTLREKVYAERDKEKRMTEGVEASELVARVAGGGTESKGDSKNRDGKKDGRSHSGGSARDEAGSGGGVEGGRGSRGSGRSRGRKVRRNSSVAAAATTTTTTSSSKLDDEETRKGSEGGATATAKTDISDMSDTHPVFQPGQKGHTGAASNVSVGGTSISRSQSREFRKVGGSGVDVHTDVARFVAA